MQEEELSRKSTSLLAMILGFVPSSPHQFLSSMEFLNPVKTFPFPFSSSNFPSSVLQDEPYSSKFRDPKPEGHSSSPIETEA